MLRSANPALTADTFTRQAYVTDGQVMTIEGTVNKTGLALLITCTTAYFVWTRFTSGLPIAGYMVVGALGGFVVALITCFKKTASPITTPLYAALEGLFLGGISATFEQKFPGIVMNAVGLTFGVLFALLTAYRSKLIPVTQNFRLGIVAATGGIALLYFVNMIMSFFGASMGFIHESSTIGIIFSLFVVGIAAFNLVIDFDFIESGVDHGAPKYMEWYAAFGLLVTLVWLYIEILRLLSKLQSRRD